MYKYFLKLFGEDQKYEISSDEPQITLATLVYLASQKYRHAEIDLVNQEISLQIPDRAPWYVFSLEDDTPLSRNTAVAADETVIVARLIFVVYRIGPGETDVIRVHPATTVEQFARMRDERLTQTRYNAYIKHSDEPNENRVNNWKKQRLLGNDTLRFVTR